MTLRPPVWAVALVVRTVVVAWTLVWGRLVSDYDESNEGAEGFFSPLTNWDAVFFRAIARDGYQYEHYGAFQPLLPAAIRVLGVPGTLLLNNVLFAASAGLFAGMSRGLGVGLWYEAGVAYALCPAGVFLSALYTESLYCFFAMVAMSCWVNKRFALCAAAVAAASLTRSNGTVLAGLLVWSAVHRSSPYLLLLAAVSVAPYLFFQRELWTVFCSPHAQCVEEAPTFLSFYPRVQSRYWDVGFMRYWRASQLPNFALALPCIGWAAGAVAWYLSYPGNRQSAARLCLREGGDEWGVFTYHLLFLLLVGVFVSHVQILPRLVAACPPLYWAAAQVLSREGCIGRRYQVLRKLFATYLTAWQLVGSVVFGNFYPWT